MEAFTLTHDYKRPSLQADGLIEWSHIMTSPPTKSSATCSFLMHSTFTNIPSFSFLPFFLPLLLHSVKYIPFHSFPPFPSSSPCCCFTTYYYNRSCSRAIILAAIVVLLMADSIRPSTFYERVIIFLERY